MTALSATALKPIGAGQPGCGRGCCEPADGDRRGMRSILLRSGVLRSGVVRPAVLRPGDCDLRLMRPTVP